MNRALLDTDLLSEVIKQNRRGGQPIGRADSMIAAIAMVHGLELVTGNIDHYVRFHSLGYRLPLVSWRSPAL